MITSEQIDLSATPIMDTTIATRTASLAVFVTALWFFVSPWAYYGVSDEVSAVNCWVVGVLMMACAGARLWYPQRFKAASWVNMVLGIWILLSPWIYGYTGGTGQLINSLCVGSIVFAFSIVAARNTRGTPLPQA